MIPFAFHITRIATDLLLGQSRFPLDQLRQEFQRRGSRPIDMTSLLWAAAIVVAIVVVTIVIARIMDVIRTGKPYRSNGLLFLSLCRAHELSWYESLQLWRLAKRKGLRPAAQIFLSPELFSEPGGDGAEISDYLADRLFPHDPGESSELRNGRVDLADGSLSA
ncbi:MAG: hypothetical protein Kow0040_17280 [Thermogutta sp.]